MRLYECFLTIDKKNVHRMYNCQVLGILTLYVFLIAKRKGKKKTYPCWTTLSVSVSADACSWRERERERARDHKMVVNKFKENQEEW
jgi:hypothetical protein